MGEGMSEGMKKKDGGWRRGSVLEGLVGSDSRTYCASEKKGILGISISNQLSSYNMAVVAIPVP